jgi:hypothetical protein
LFAICSSANERTIDVVFHFTIIVQDVKLFVAQNLRNCSGVETFLPAMPRFDLLSFGKKAGRLCLFFGAAAWGSIVCVGIYCCVVESVLSSEDRFGSLQ